jgi:hypothetical protein
MLCVHRYNADVLWTGRLGTAAELIHIALMLMVAVILLNLLIGMTSQISNL